MRVKVAKWGNSIAVRLPARAVSTIGIKPGDELAVTTSANAVMLARIQEGVPTLKEMAAEMERLGPEAEPEAVDWGPDVGSERLPSEDWSELLRRFPPDTLPQ